MDGLSNPLITSDTDITDSQYVKRSINLQNTTLMLQRKSVDAGRCRKAFFFRTAYGNQEAYFLLSTNYISFWLHLCILSSLPISGCLRFPSAPELPSSHSPLTSIHFTSSPIPSSFPKILFPFIPLTLQVPLERELRASLKCSESGLSLHNPSATQLLWRRSTLKSDLLCGQKWLYPKD